MNVVRRSLAGLLLVGLPCVGIVVACSSTGRPPPREVPVVESSAPASEADDSFVVVFLGDPEERMRGITRSTLERHVDRLRSVGDGPAGERFSAALFFCPDFRLGRPPARPGSSSPVTPCADCSPPSSSQ